MDLRLQYYLSNDFNNKAIQILTLLEITLRDFKALDESQFKNIQKSQFDAQFEVQQNCDEKNLDENLLYLDYLEKNISNADLYHKINNLFQELYPSINYFLKIKKVKDPDFASDFIFLIYQTFIHFLLKANQFRKGNKDFIFYYYFIKFLNLQYMNFKRKKANFKDNSLEFDEKIQYEFSYNKISDNDYNEMDVIRKCIDNHLTSDEKALFLVYYFFLIRTEDLYFLSSYFSIELSRIIELFLNENKKNDDIGEYSQNWEKKENSALNVSDDFLKIEEFNSRYSKKFEIASEELINFLFGQNIANVRVSILRIKQKMKKRCNYLLDYDLLY